MTTVEVFDAFIVVSLKLNILECGTHNPGGVVTVLSRVVMKILWWLGLCAVAFSFVVSTGLLPYFNPAAPSPVVMTGSLVMDATALVVIASWVVGILCWVAWGIVAGVVRRRAAKAAVSSEVAATSSGSAAAASTGSALTPSTVEEDVSVNASAAGSVLLDSALVAGSLKSLVLRVLRWLRVGFAAVVVALSMLMSLLCLSMSDNYHVLRPSSAGGCSIVVSSSAGLWDAGGYVYLMRPDSRALTDTGGSWSVSNDPGTDPIEEGTWSLRWNHETAQLNIWSTDPIGYFDWPKPIVCPE